MHNAKEKQIVGEDGREGPFSLLNFNESMGQCMAVSQWLDIGFWSLGETSKLEIVWSVIFEDLKTNTLLVDCISLSVKITIDSIQKNLGQI